MNIFSVVSCSRDAAYRNRYARGEFVDEESSVSKSSKKTQDAYGLLKQQRKDMAKLTRRLLKPEVSQRELKKRLAEKRMVKKQEKAKKKREKRRKKKMNG